MPYKTGDGGNGSILDYHIKLWVYLADMAAAKVDQSGGHRWKQKSIIMQPCIFV
jgi:hypothetical protein